MFGLKGDGFSTVLVINRVSIFATLVINRVWVLYSSLDMGMFLRSSYICIRIDKTIHKKPLANYFYAKLTLICTRELIIKQV